MHKKLFLVALFSIFPFALFNAQSVKLNNYKANNPEWRILKQEWLF
jgi:hypothetical protein